MAYGHRVGGSPAAAVELRIHGVGGSTPESLLGERHPDDVRLVHGGDPDGFWARRRDPSVQGYVWGPLTAGSPLQALWFVLLPFTLVNVAGWMHPPAVDPASRRRARWVRGLVLALGVTLTVTWAVWMCIILADLLAYRAAAGVDPPSDGRFLAVMGAGLALAAIGLAWRVAWPLVGLGAAAILAALAWRTAGSAGARGTWGVAAAGLAMGGLTLIAGRSRRKFEEFPPLADPGASPAAVPVATGRRRITDDEGLDSPTFFARPADSKWLLAVHVVAVVVTLAVALARVWMRAGDDKATLSFGSFLAVVAAAQFVLVALLTAVSTCEISNRDRRWRFAGPAVAVTLGIMLSNAVFAGLALWIRRRFDVVGALGSELALLDVFVAVTLVFLAFLLLAWLPYYVMARPADAADVDDDWRGPVARRRRLARAFRSVDLPLSVWSLALLVAGTVFSVLRIKRLDGCSGICLAVDVTAFDMPALRSLGEWVLPFAAIGSSLIIRAGLRNEKARSNVGNLWDVMTFWPRRYHPFAVRPYAERAVPRLQQYIESQPGPVVVSAHSQGTILAFAALRGMAGRPKLEMVALATYGSPLSRLHARFFPHYFHPDQFAALHGELAEWRNFYRRTDHIGQQVFDEVGPAAGDDVVLPDPVVDPPADDDPDAPWEPDPDPRRAVAGHNDYRRQPELKAWVRSAKERLRT